LKSEEINFWKCF